MIGTNTCPWVLLGFRGVCGKRCMGEYCGIHRDRLAKGGGTHRCVKCGRGTKSKHPTCELCGANKARVYEHRAKKYAITEEFKRLCGAFQNKEAE